MDLVIEDGSRVDAVYFLMAEDNLARGGGGRRGGVGCGAAAQAPQSPLQRPTISA
jgi:N-acyl-D-amino-acid deacylase